MASIASSGVGSELATELARLEEEAISPKDAALQHLRRFQQSDNFKIGGDAKTRVAPQLVAKLYRRGRTAAAELEQLVQERGLTKCHAAAEMPTMGLVLDRLVVHSRDTDVINMPAVEVVCRRIYGALLAFEDVKEEADWKQPRNSNGKWKSKVKWGLLKEYDVKALESNDWRIPEADKEVTDRLQQKALFNKHLEKSGVAAAGAEGQE